MHTGHGLPVKRNKAIGKPQSPCLLQPAKPTHDKFDLPQAVSAREGWRMFCTSISKTAPCAWLLALHAARHRTHLLMNPFNRLPNSRRAPSGLEWQVLKKIPSTLLAASLGCTCFVLLLRSGWFGLPAEASARAEFSSVGLLLSFWIITLTVTLGCVIVVVMKGPAYVRDAYPLPEQRDRKQEAGESE